jgi:hypothetical protein
MKMQGFRPCRTVPQPAPFFEYKKTPSLRVSKLNLFEVTKCKELRDTQIIVGFPDIIPGLFPVIKIQEIAQEASGSEYQEKVNGKSLD